MNRSKESKGVLKGSLHEGAQIPTMQFFKLRMRHDRSFDHCCIETSILKC